MHVSDRRRSPLENRPKHFPNSSLLRPVTASRHPPPPVSISSVSGKPSPHPQTRPSLSLSHHSHEQPLPSHRPTLAPYSMPSSAFPPTNTTNPYHAPLISLHGQHPPTSSNPQPSMPRHATSAILVGPPYLYPSFHSKLLLRGALTHPRAALAP